MKSFPNEHRIRRLPDWDYSTNGSYFITFCTFNRAPILGSIHAQKNALGVQAELVPSQIGEACIERIEELAQQSKSPFIEDYAVMPNHVHLLACISSDEHDESSAKELRTQAIPRLVSSIKTFVTRIARARGLEHRVWQRSYHDHIVRDEAEYNRIREYIDNNPLKWALDKFYVDRYE